MTTSDSPKCRRIRRDGWTPERQLQFLDALASTRSVATAAASAGMSREGAHRLRNRSEGTLFAFLWDRALAPDPRPHQVHTGMLTDGQIMRLLGNHFRRKRGDSWIIGQPKADRRRT
ncbi:MAG TPA: hypothetical protein VIK68_01870 [Sphingomicrobium sp.]